MRESYHVILLLAIVLAQCIHNPVGAQESLPKTLIVSERVGEEIDRQERDEYGLFPAVENFVSARVIQTHPDSLVLLLVVMDGGQQVERKIPLTPESLSNLAGQIEFLHDKSKEELMLEIDNPKFRVSQGIVGSLGALFGGFLSLAFASDLDLFPESRLSFYAIWGLGSAFVSTLGVHSSGKFGQDAEFFLPTLLGSIVGSGLGVLLFEGGVQTESAGLVILGYAFIQPALTAIGGIRGYHWAVKSRVSKSRLGLLNLDRNGLRFDVPGIRVGAAPGTGRFVEVERTYKIEILNLSF
jgi:hypothetical protein